MRQPRITIFSDGVCRRRPIAARLDRNAVVSGVEDAILNQHFAAGVRIAPVGVGPGAVDRQISHDDVAAQRRRYLPHRRVQQRHAFDQNVFTLIWLNELRPQKVPFAEDTLFDRCAPFAKREQLIPVVGLFRLACLPPALGLPLPRPPESAVGVSIERALAGDGDILLLEGIDEGGEVQQFHTFPPGKHVGVRAGIAAKTNGGAFADFQIYPAEQPDSAADVLACRHEDATASSQMASSNRIAKRSSAVRFAVANRSKLQHIPFPLWEARCLYPRQNRWKSLPRVLSAENPRRRGFQPAPAAAQQGRPGGKGAHKCAATGQGNPRFGGTCHLGEGRYKVTACGKTPRSSSNKIQRRRRARPPGKINHGDKGEVKKYLLECLKIFQQRRKARQ